MVSLPKLTTPGTVATTKPGVALEPPCIECKTCTQGCYAPVFPPPGFALGLGLRALYTALLVFLPVLLVLSGGRPWLACFMRQLLFRIEHYREGNSATGIDLDPDPYGSHVQETKNRYGKSDAWATWMLDNQVRYEPVFRKARDRPGAIVVSFRYESTPITYNPPWANEGEHMFAMELFADLSYPSFAFNFVFGGDPATSYANVIAGTASLVSYQSGNDVHLHYETIFAHEFGHVMYLLHHYYVTPGDAPQTLPPGETACIMARNAVQWCSACRTALCLPLDADHEAEITTAMEDISQRYPPGF